MTSNEFANRRDQLLRLMGDDGIALVPAAPVHYRSGDSAYPFRQNSDFYYLTGFAEPEAMALIMPHGAEGEFVLFCRPRDPMNERWEGVRTGLEGAVDRYGADQAFPIDAVDRIVPALLASRRKLYCTLGRCPNFDQRIIGWINGLRPQAKNGVHAPRDFVALDHCLQEMRVRKSPAELEQMRKSAQLTINAHQRAMRAARPGKMEYEIAAEILYEFHRHGTAPAYWPIVANSGNACVLHYRDNASPLADGALLLVDAGCESAYYASDVTRTYPVNGRFSPEQRAVYEVVLSAQRAAIDTCTAGNPWNAVHEAAVRETTRGLIDLGLLRGTLANLIEEGAYREFFMHKTGHWLGMDVHDVGQYKVDDRWRPLEPGMAFTVEPGLYIPATASDVPKAFRGIGVRIEDDLVVTSGRPEILTGGLVKDPDDLEAFIRGVEGKRDSTMGV
jgi:Xaa-Pro aminopeptidase